MAQPPCRPPPWPSLRGEYIGTAGLLTIGIRVSGPWAKVEAVDQESVALSPTPRWVRQAGSQPIPGYRLIEPLGRGGFGEVWKCEAPGGLFKAVKFVANQQEEGGAASQEREALQLVKTIRHPFILSLDRVEVVDDVLVIVMELADKSLFSLLAEYQGRKLPGIPREELLGYLLEVAEALDWMNFGHGLQHLDIKPHNLFLVSNHVKVADFGLVDRLSDVDQSHPMQRQGGMTPLYAAPELLRGTVSRHCDQYSLAIVYQQLLTGTVPFWCQNMYQLMLLHLTGEPNLTPLPAEDRAIIGRVLSKHPEDRYPSCLDFLQALVCGEGKEKLGLPLRAWAVRKLVTPLTGEEKPAPPRSPSASGDTPADVGTAEAALATRLIGGTNDGPATPEPGADTMARPPHFCSPSGLRPRVGTLYTPTCVSLPGYRFLQCVNQTPLGDIWKAEDKQGQPRRALCLYSFVEEDPVLIERLQNLTHPILPPTEISWSPAGRLVLVTDELTLTLRDRLDACQKQGLPGIPREEALGHLRLLAEALDTLYAQYNLPHLGLNPRALFLDDDTLWLADYGLVPLVWMPTGQTAGSVNSRYAAPELFERADLSGIPEGEIARAALMGRAGPASDQFSLALIYAELLNGIPPIAPRPAPSIRRGQRKGRRGDSTMIPLHGSLRVDMDLLPASDRAVLQRALAEDPAKRFGSCTEFIAALERAAAQTTRREEMYHRLPTVIPFTSLQGEPPPSNIVLPPLNQLVLSLATPAMSSLTPPRTVLGPQNVRYLVQSEDVWECKCPIQMFAGTLSIKVSVFCEEWHARRVHEQGDSFTFHLDVQPSPRSSRGDRDAGTPLRLAFELHVLTTPGSIKHFAEARMRVRPAGGDRERVARYLPEVAPPLFDSMRRYLQAGPEQRSEDRWQCPQPLHVYPVRTDLEMEEVLEGLSRNISFRGVSFRVPKAPATEVAYLHWHKSAALSAFAVLIRIMRVQPMAGGGYEVGATFPTAT
jgi:serine/threonine protein kinase